MIPRHTPCPLGKEDIAMVEKHAILRVNKNRENGSIYTGYNIKNQIEAERDTFGAEVAFCRLFGTEPDMRIGVFPPHDTT